MLQHNLTNCSAERLMFLLIDRINASFILWREPRMISQQAKIKKDLDIFVHDVQCRRETQKIIPNTNFFTN